MSWTPVDLLALDDQPAPDPAWCGLVYRGQRHVFSGEPESLKTLAAMIITLEVVRHGDHVIYLDWEMGARAFKTRLRELGAADGDIASISYVEPETQPADADLKALIRDDTALVILDAAAGAFDAADLDGDRTRDAERFARVYLRAFWRAGIATVVIDHVVKDKRARGKYTSGNHRKVGGADTHVSFEAVNPLSRGRTGLAHVFTRKDRHGHLARPRAIELEVQSDSETHALTWTWRPPTAKSEPKAKWRPTVLMERVSEFLEGCSKPVSQAEVERSVQGTNEWIRKAIDALVEEGCAADQRGPRNARMISHIKRFTTSPDPAATSPDGEVNDLATSPSRLQAQARSANSKPSTDDHNLADHAEPGGALFGSDVA